MKLQMFTSFPRTLNVLSYTHRSPTPLATGDSLYFSGIHHRIVVYGGSDHVVTKSLSLPNLPSEVTNSHAMVRARNARRSAMAAATSTDSDGTSTPTLSHSHRLSSSSFIGGRTPPLAEIREVRRSNHDCTKDDAATRSSAEQALASGVANLTVTTTPRTPIHRSSRSAPTTDTSFLTPAASSSGVGSADTTHGGRHHHPPSATPSPSLSSSRLSSPSTIYTPQVGCHVHFVDLVCFVLPMLRFVFSEWWPIFFVLNYVVSEAYCGHRLLNVTRGVRGYETENYSLSQNFCVSLYW